MKPFCVDDRQFCIFYNIEEYGKYGTQMKKLTRQKNTHTQKKITFSTKRLKQWENISSFLLD
jgi:hypothetical protein